MREAAVILGLTDALKKKPRTLSGGQRQRVAMGRAIVRQPQAFLMDEPLSNLDAKLRVEMRAEIARLQRDLSVTTVYVTHDQTEAMTMGDRVAVMRNGLLQQVDAPQVLYERPRNLFVAEFIGSPAMNVVMADLARADGDVWVQLRRAAPPTRPVARSSGARRCRASRAARSILGIRPEDMEDAALVGGDAATTAACRSCATSARTWAPRSTSTSTCRQKRSRRRRWSRPSSPMLPRTRRPRLAAERARGEGVLVRRPPRPRHAGSRAATARAIDVDVARLHFFDPETGLGIYDDHVTPEAVSATG